MRLILLSLMAGCSDQTFHTSDDAKPSAGEECDGLDNDADGMADEGFGDADGDGTADCVDDTCALGASPPGVAGERSCAPDGAPSVDPFNLEVGWSWGTMSACTFAAVASVGSGETADVICSGDEGQTASLVALSGGDGRELFNIPYADSFLEPPVAVGDVDNDGAMDVLTLNEDESHAPYVGAFTGSGVLLWRSAANDGFLSVPGVGLSAALLAADLDRDGSLEVVTRAGILRGRDGVMLQAFPEVEPGTNRTLDMDEIAIADLDMDGKPEILEGWRALSPSGYLIWDLSTAVSTTDQFVGAPLVVQADADPEGELVVAGYENLYLVDTDGALLNIIPTGSDEGAGAPAALDVDGDGMSDLVYSTASTFRAVRLDGTIVWSTPEDPRYDIRSVATTADLDGDGLSEILFNTVSELIVLRASDGALLWASPPYPTARYGRTIVADLEGDGSAELVSTVALWDAETGPALTVYRHVPGGRLAPAPPFWPNNTWSGSGLLPDGSAQPDPPNAWLEWGIFRGQPPGYEWGSELSVELLDYCVSSCADDGLFRVSFRLDNLGPQRSPAGVHIEAYGLSEDGTRTLLETFTTAEDLAAPEGSAPWELDTTTAQAKIGLVFVVLNEGGIARHDCDPTNDELTWALNECP